MSVMLLYGLLSVTHAQGWSIPLITQDSWSYISGQEEHIQVSGTDTLHQVWSVINNEARIGYQVYKPDGTVIFPETMVSNDVWSAFSNSCLVNEDSVALFWREGVPAWYNLRDSNGEELVPTSLLFTDSYVNRPGVEASSDSLGRIHCVFEISAGVCYAVFDPATGEIFRDTIPGSSSEISNICVDGNRVHIFYTAGYALPAYIQYDLSGNIVIPPVELVQGIEFLSPQSSVTVDNDGNFWCLLKYLAEGASYTEPYVLKIDAITGNVLVEKEVGLSDKNENDVNILPGAGGETLYLMWTANSSQGKYFIYFTIIDKDGNFIEELYPAYDYGDEEVQNIFCLDATSNEVGDVFAVWSAYFPEVHPNAYYIVMGWFDHNWVGVEESETSPVASVILSMTCSANPFKRSVMISIEGSSIPEQLMIYDTSGRLVRRLPSSGGRSFLWDGKDSQGAEAAAGCYTVYAVTDTERRGLRVVKLD